MSSFSARLRMAGQSRILLGVLVDVTQETITATFADNEVARWRLDEVDISHLPDGFHISGAGGEAVVGVTESSRFASALGVRDRRPGSSAVARNPRRSGGQGMFGRLSIATAGGPGR